MDRRQFARGLSLATAAIALPAVAVARPSPEHPNAKVRRLAREMAETLRDPAFIGWRSVTVTPDGAGYQDADDGSSDPIIGAVKDYRAGLDDFNRNAPMDCDEAADAYAAVSFMAPMERLRCWTAPARTRAGAIAALQQAQASQRDGDFDIPERMIDAALAYLTWEA